MAGVMFGVAWGANQFSSLLLAYRLALVLLLASSGLVALTLAGIVRNSPRNPSGAGAPA